MDDKECPGAHRRRKESRGDELLRHQACHPSPAPSPAIFLPGENSVRHLRLRTAEVYRRRGGAAGPRRHRQPDGGEGGRAAGQVPERLRRRRAGGARVAHGVLGVQDDPGRHQRVREDHGEEAPHAARQLRGSRLRQDGHDHGLRRPHARGGSAQRGRGGAAAGRLSDRQVLHQGQGGVVRELGTGWRCVHGPP